MAISPVSASGSEGELGDSYQDEYIGDIPTERLQPAKLSHAEIIEIAETCRKSWGYEPHADLQKIVIARGGIIRTTDNWDDPYDDVKQGSIYILPTKKFVIWLSPRASATANRFTIAHELGHFELHYRRSAADLTEKVMMAARYNLGEADHQADIFAINFLIDRAVLRDLREKQKSLAQMADYFGVAKHLVTQQLEAIEHIG